MAAILFTIAAVFLGLGFLIAATISKDATQLFVIGIVVSIGLMAAAYAVLYAGCSGKGNF